MKKDCFIKSRHKLDRYYYRRLMEKLDTSSIQVQSIENYDFRNFRSKIQFMMTWMIRVSLLTTLSIYNAYFKSNHTHRLRTHTLYEKLLRLCALRFHNQVFPDLHCLWSEEFCSQQQSIKLLELVTYWNLCKGVSHRLKICTTKERSLL